MIESACHVAAEGASSVLRDLAQTLLEGVLNLAGPAQSTDGPTTMAREAKTAKENKL